MGFWSKLKKVLSFGWKVSKFFYTPPKVIEIIADSILKVEKDKTFGKLKGLNSKILHKTAIDEAIKNKDLLDWAEKQIGKNDIEEIKTFISPIIEDFYKNNKKKIKKKIK